MHSASSDPSVRRALALGTAAVQEAMAQAAADKAQAVSAERAHWEALVASERAAHQHAQQELGKSLAERFEAAAAACMVFSSVSVVLSSLALRLYAPPDLSQKTGERRCRRWFGRDAPCDEERESFLLGTPKGGDLV